MVVWLAVAVVPAHAALPVTATPVLRLDHLLRTHPFAGSTVSMKDNEGSAYVARDNSLWLCDDSGRMLYEVNAATGALKRTIGQNALKTVPQLGGGPEAGRLADQDLESMAYDAATDTLYAFSGVDSAVGTPSPSVFRLKRVDGELQPVDFQPLKAGSDFTASAWNPADGKIYVGATRFLQTYDYRTNKAGPSFVVPDLIGIFGLEFTADGKDLFVARDNRKLSRVDWASKTLVPGWTFDLTPFGVLDARAVELIGDKIFVSDGYEGRAADDPMNHAVFVFDVGASSGTPVVAPTAAFSASTTSGAAPLTVSFTDRSTGATGWVWSFGDGGSTSVRNPIHVFTRPGTYTVRLTVSNAAGSRSATTQVTAVGVADTTPPTVALKRPTTNVGALTSWQRLRGTATDGTGSGVRTVMLRLLEKRGTAWYAYRSSSRTWVRSGSRTTALKQASLVRVTTTSTHRWSCAVSGVRKGTLVIRLSATDKAGNTSAVKVYRQLLTRR